MKKLALAIAMLLVFATVTAFGAGRSQSEKVVIYSPHGEVMLTDLADRFESETGITVEFLTAGGGELVDRIRAERANPQADVFYGNPSSVFSELASDGIFAAYTPSWADRVDPLFKDPGSLKW